MMQNVNEPRHGINGTYVHLLRDFHDMKISVDASRRHHVSLGIPGFAPGLAGALKSLPLMSRPCIKTKSPKPATLPLPCVKRPAGSKRASSASRPYNKIGKGR